ncbi:hypothetical protein [Helicobacter sp. MIT 05-5294]|uniref:hypothetical protein n=1 Tax=Helicobacter sp. MIT 05-5294 TaxID=1548150 RepID=UPI00051F8E01|nr:hypothetical protein [Helicobacter sp. MIT 05-5294]TLD85629.1 hypothetical protein LS69_008620 [Helicobacter sp. MIT 05-5294]
MKKMVLMALSLAMCVSVASASSCWSEEKEFKQAIEKCQYTGENSDCNKAAAAQAKYNACLNKEMLEQQKIRDSQYRRY